MCMWVWSLGACVNFVVWVYHVYTYNDNKLFEILNYWEEGDEKPRQHFRKQRHHLPDKGLHSESYGFSCSDVWK